MGVTPEELAEQQAVGVAVTEPTPLRPFRIIPGGAAAIREEWVAAAVILGALALLWIMRRNMANEPGHVHVGGTAAIVFLLYYLIATAIIRAFIDFASKGGERNTPVTRGLGFFA